MELEEDMMELPEVLIEADCEEACERVAVEAEHASILNTTRINVQEENVSFRGDLWRVSLNTSAIVFVNGL